MRNNDRYEQFTAELSQRGKLELDELCELINISPSTARRFCIQAEQSGLGIRLHGGAIQSSRTFAPQAEYMIETRETEHIQEKRAIGKYASTLVESNEIIYVSSGTTTEQFLFYLAERVKSGKIENVRIMTNSFRIVALTPDSLPVIFTGGFFRRDRQDFAGEVARAAVQNARFNKCFIGTDGIDLPTIVASDEETIALDFTAISQADRAFILADYSKFSSRSYIRSKPLLSNHVIITDSNIHESYLRLASECGTAIKVVDLDPIDHVTSPDDFLAEY